MGSFWCVLRLRGGPGSIVEYALEWKLDASQVGSGGIEGDSHIKFWVGCRGVLLSQFNGGQQYLSYAKDVKAGFSVLLEKGHFYKCGLCMQLASGQGW